MPINYGPGDIVICINTAGVNCLERGAEYTCHDVWQCGHKILTCVEEVTAEGKLIGLDDLIPILTGQPCDTCGKPTDKYLNYDANRFIKKPIASDFEHEEEEDSIHRVVPA